MSTFDDAKNSIGQLLITGFKGFELSEETSAFLSQARVGGVIYFSHNYKDPEQIANLSNQVQECRSTHPLWISVDQEGGRVQRFKDGFTIIPPAGQVGQCKSPKAAFSISEIMAKELKTVGVNVNFCPVADINTNPSNPVIGDRSYGETEENVSKIVSAVVRGHLVHNVQPCIKHFPGHGDTSVDSHLELPRVDTDLATLRDREFRPFVKAAKSRCRMIMTAHILNPNLDPERPATLSPKVLGDILRNELRYSRVVVSDDMQMQAITDNFGETEAPVMAIEAGCDLLIYRDEDRARKAYTSLVKALEDERLSPSKILESVARSHEVKKEFFGDYAPVEPSKVAALIGTDEHKKIVEDAINS